MESQSRKTDGHFWNMGASGVNQLPPFSLTVQTDFAPTVQNHSSRSWRYMWKIRRFSKLVSIFWFKQPKLTMFIAPWERLPQKELRKSQTFCNIHCVIQSFVGHFTAGDWILISSMSSGAVPVGDLQVSSFDRVFKGTFCSCSSFPSQC